MQTTSEPGTAHHLGGVELVGEVVRKLEEAVGVVVVGKSAVVETAVAAVVAGTHLLIEDVPGVGKTLLAQALAAAAGGTYRRIQGTADLLPGDVTGSLVPDSDGRTLIFRHGPVFANFVLFDELNRASPRAQSALLEAAEENRVTIDGHSWALPEPFTLLATQNPSGMVGTYRLGEGAADRFGAVITPGRAAFDDEVSVLSGHAGRIQLEALKSVVDIGTIADARHAVRDVQLHSDLAAYVVSLLTATREHPDVKLGASTRGGVATVAFARVRAARAGRDYVTSDDIDHVAGGTLAHRIVLGQGGGLAEARQVLDECFAQVPAPRR